MTTGKSSMWLDFDSFDKKDEFLLLKRSILTSQIQRREQRFLDMNTMNCSDWKNEADR